MVEYPGNLMRAPHFAQGAVGLDDELMYSMNGYQQKGATIKAGQGVLLLGTVMARKTGDKKWYAYDPTGAGGVTNEKQTLTEGGTGLTSFTITYSGQTTASIDDDATAAQVQTALEALSNLAPGDVIVTGGPLGTGPFTVEFAGTLADTNVDAMTTTPTGGSGTVVVATTQVGNTADGIDTARGFLRRTVDTGTVATAVDFQGNVVTRGMVNLAKVNAAGNLDNDAIVDLNARTDGVYGYLSF